MMSASVVMGIGIEVRVRCAIVELANELGQLVGPVFPLFSFGQGRFAFGDALPTGQFCQFRVELGHVLLVTRHVFFGVNGVDRALGNTDGAVDAFVGVNGQKIGAFAKAVHGADVDAIGVLAFDAGFSDGMGHFYRVLAMLERATLKRASRRILIQQDCARGFVRCGVHQNQRAEQT